MFQIKEMSPYVWYLNLNERNRSLKALSTKVDVCSEVHRSESTLYHSTNSKQHRKLLVCLTVQETSWIEAESKCRK